MKPGGRHTKFCPLALGYPSANRSKRRVSAASASEQRQSLSGLAMTRFLSETLSGTPLRKGGQPFLGEV